MRTAIACLKFLAFTLLCVAIVPPQSAILFFTKGKKSYALTYIWHRWVCKIFRIKINLSGSPDKSGQIIYIGNHISYLDIPVIASILQYASFVAKEDVEDWPVFGFLSKLQQTAFISRSKENAAKGKQALETMLDDGKSLIIFPEGTSTDGREVLPFKSSLFAIFFKDNLKDIKLQPFTLSMVSANGHEIRTQDDRDLYAWHLNMDTSLAKHLWDFAKSTGAEINLTFHPPLLASDFNDRKTLAKACHETVSKGLEK
ncbi:MAG: 1-acyl-sn-glycerol-3-phosphate acyltransferase [Alphaproteobacteria bacterium]|nr:1-acyl-sn-glycerol-3-phosphate acyltransferase [Alphaproteobacteria bacterium]